jgi:predicted transcriptional regulator of viral defense system
MQTSEFLRFLEDNGMHVFNVNDAAKILHQKRGYTKLFLHRCASRGLIARIERGLYYLREKTNEYEIASSILSPSYVSMVSALYYYGLTTQISHTIYVISSKWHHKINDAMGYEISFRTARKDMLFGYHKEAGGNISIADPEKAIVDIYYFNDINDLDEKALDRPSRIDVAKLVRYAGMSGRDTVKSRVATLLAEHGYKREATRLLGMQEKRRAK